MNNLNVKILSKNFKFHYCIKHIDVRYYSMREKMINKLIKNLIKID